ncbi:MAG: sensor histidine kinase [Nitrospiraceae bacterium]|nr:MAG: sensor histidine kinase [Nitrospiraceae bacterium]
MSLKKKIILGFLTSSVIIAVLVVFGFISFIEIRKEIRYLELSDNLRGKSLQLRRHEKNFFLYGELEEVENVHTYLRDLKTLMEQSRRTYKNDELAALEKKTVEYEQKFFRIEKIFTEVRAELDQIEPLNSKYAVLFRLVESTFLERPLVNAELLQKTFSLREGDPVIQCLQELHILTAALRKDGEEVLTISRELDKSARENAERFISLSQTTALILLPLFFGIGLLALFVISHGIVKRLKILSDAIERTGKGDFSMLSVPEKQDEVGVLIGAFNRMETDLVARDRELTKKNEELHQSRKLASIGTLASGVAHELNNPLNNIYTTAQRLIKKPGECPPSVMKGLDDIFSQAMRVKKIVGDLLEFARGRDPQLRETELRALVAKAYQFVGASSDTGNIQFSIESNVDSVSIPVDTEQMEQVFINLFNNAVEAMSGRGNINVEIESSGDLVKILVTDTGQGISRENAEKIFEPFFTTKDKGTGLGLAIVFNIIQKHNGHINVQSEERKGTTFTITLPYRQTGPEKH